jgi:hypothetical protein
VDRVGIPAEGVERGGLDAVDEPAGLVAEPSFVDAAGAADDWRNVYDPDGSSYRITTDRAAPVEPNVAVAKSYGDILREYRVHPEYKFNGLDGQPCPRNTRGLLQRRPIHLAGPVRLIGKEANNIDNVQAGLYAQLHEIITEYVKDDHFHQQVMPLLDDLSGHKLARRVGTHPPHHSQNPRWTDAAAGSTQQDN